MTSRRQQKGNRRQDYASSAGEHHDGLPTPLSLLSRDSRFESTMAAALVSLADATTVGAVGAPGQKSKNWPELAESLEFGV
mmetsp:Transcript_32914/g.78612  ORF Transcript_32914/g.78612 Transcript_32914/m.78612 type:complete len:81 (-) Transcript_32914:34-276(-)